MLYRFREAQVAVLGLGSRADTGSKLPTHVKACVMRTLARRDPPRGQQQSVQDPGLSTLMSSSFTLVHLAHLT